MFTQDWTEELHQAELKLDVLRNEQEALQNLRHLSCKDLREELAKVQIEYVDKEPFDVRLAERRIPDQNTFYEALPDALHEEIR